MGFTFDTDAPRINFKSQSRYVTLGFLYTYTTTDASWLQQR